MATWFRMVHKNPKKLKEAKQRLRQSGVRVQEEPDGTLIALLNHLQNKPRDPITGVRFKPYHFKPLRTVSAPTAVARPPVLAPVRRHTTEEAVVMTIHALTQQEPIAQQDQDQGPRPETPVEAMEAVEAVEAQRAPAQAPAPAKRPQRSTWDEECPAYPALSPMHRKRLTPYQFRVTERYLQGGTLSAMAKDLGIATHSLSPAVATARKKLGSKYVPYLAHVAPTPRQQPVSTPQGQPTDLSALLTQMEARREHHLAMAIKYEEVLADLRGLLAADGTRH